MLLHVMYICMCMCVHSMCSGIFLDFSINDQTNYYLIFVIFIILPKQVHPKTKIEDQDELSSLLQVPIVVCTYVTYAYNCGLTYLMYVRVCKYIKSLLCLCTYRLTADVHTLGNDDFLQYTPPPASCTWSSCRDAHGNIARYVGSRFNSTHDSRNITHSEGLLLYFHVFVGRH